MSKKSLLGEESLFVFLNDNQWFQFSRNFPYILIQVYYNQSGFVYLTKISLHRELFLRVSWRRGGSGGKVDGNWVGRGLG